METLASANPLPGFLNSLAGPLDHYGYGAIALLLLLENIGVPVIPGELAMIAGAIFAGTGRAGLNVVVVGVVAVAAAIAGAEIGYLIGRFAGRELILHYGRWVFVKSHHLDRAEATVSRFGGLVVLIARFIVGLREANGIIAGLTQMRWLTFGWFNVLGACAWVATWVSIGYLAGGHIDAIYHDINRYAHYVLLAVAVLLAAYIIRRVARRRRHRAGSVTTETSETTEDREARESSGAEEVDEVIDYPVAQVASGAAAQEDPGTQKAEEDSATQEDSGTQDHQIEGDSAAQEDSGTQKAEEDSVAQEDPGAEDDEAGEDPATRESP
jgi:membrane protein DedA with SNARE-associated domain